MHSIHLFTCKRPRAAVALLLLLATAGAAGAASGVGNSGDGWLKLDCSAESPLTAVKDLDVLLGDIKGRVLVAKYSDSEQFREGKAIGLSIHRDLIINEVSIVETESGRAQPDGQPARKRIANRQSWRLEFDGNHYVLPAAVRAMN